MFTISNFNFERKYLDNEKRDRAKNIALVTTGDIIIIEILRPQNIERTVQTDSAQLECAKNFIKLPFCENMCLKMVL